MIALTRKAFFLCVVLIAQSGIFAQSLQYPITTTSVVSNSVGEHIDHARPVGLLPFLVSGTVDCDLTTTIDYTFAAINWEPFTVTFSPEMYRSWAYVTNTACWGTDAATVDQRFPIFESYTLTAGERDVFSGTQVVQSSWSFDLSGCSIGGIGDGLHTGAESSVFAGPIQQSGWSASMAANVVAADIGTVFTNELTITANYDLPLLAGPNGCNPLQSNSTGATGVLEAYGDADLQEGFVVLAAHDLPASQLAIVILGTSTQPAAPIALGQATLCLGGALYRWHGSSTQFIGTDGTYDVELPFDSLPIPGGVITAGSTWGFQLFHRDVVNGASSANSTNAVVLTF